MQKETPTKKNFILEKHQPTPHPSAKDSAGRDSPNIGGFNPPWRPAGPGPSNWCPAGRHTAKAREAATHTCCSQLPAARGGLLDLSRRVGSPIDFLFNRNVPMLDDVGRLILGSKTMV